MTPDQVTRHFHKHIPISQAMGVKVLEVSSRHARLELPLIPNINHVHTVFGGSLYAAAALSCYAVFQAISHEAGGLSDNLVIQEGNIRYLSPVSQDFIIEAHLKNPDDDKRFIEAVHRHGKARLELEAHIHQNGKLCAQFTGTYVYRKVASSQV